MDWNELVRHENGKLYWLPRKVNSRWDKIWNKRFAGTEAGFKHSTGYVRVKYEGMPYNAHRIIWQLLKGHIPKGLHVDHINGDRADNRIQNLQLLTLRQNVSRRTDATGYQKKGKRYIARKTYKSECYYLNTFGTPCGAYMAHKMFFVNMGAS